VVPVWGLGGLTRATTTFRAAGLMVGDDLGDIFGGEVMTWLREKWRLLGGESTMGRRSRVWQRKLWDTVAYGVWRRCIGDSDIAMIFGNIDGKEWGTTATLRLEVVVLQTGGVRGMQGVNFIFFIIKNVFTFFLKMNKDNQKNENYFGIFFNIFIINYFLSGRNQVLTF